MRANDTADEFKTPNPYSQNYISVEKFLDIISLEQTSSEDGNRFCLSHVFTYRDFEDGVLGLAWRASPGMLARQKYLPGILLGNVLACVVKLNFVFLISSWRRLGRYL
jgi:hypothetical protein